MRKTSVIILLAISACSIKPSPNKFSDPELRKIYDLKDRRQRDSLLVYLRSENPLYRREAAEAFASVQDTLASQALGTALLEDADAGVRLAAAFALGQTGGFTAVNALIPALEAKERSVVREVLEALGKTVTARDSHFLTQYNSGDTLLQEGQVWGLYQLALRRVADSSATRKASQMLDATRSYQTRLGAAHFFGRSATVAGTGFGETLARAASSDKFAEVRMAAVNGLKHAPGSIALPTLASLLRADDDYRVRANAARTAANFSDAEAASLMLAALEDTTEMVQVAASEALLRVADKVPVDRLTNKIEATRKMRVKANLYAVLIKSGKDYAPERILNEIPADDNYAASALLGSLREAGPPFNKKVFESLAAIALDTTRAKVVLTSAAGALVSINRNLGDSAPAAVFLDVYKKAVANGDPAVTAIICGALVDESLGYRKEVKDPGFLREARAKLELPRDIESIEPLDRAIAYLEGKPLPEPAKNSYNHPIDWKRAAAVERDQRVAIKTGKGTIVVSLLVEEAPGSVLNFIDLVEKKYFDKKVFHRVVPNFVVQAGCKRGDGFGSEDYSIRSEFSLKRYTTGCVGMASAGKDTEGTQWFITHSPTPHLDGKYTIFAEVVSGMDVVHRLDVGDRIEEVTLVIR